MSKLWMKDNKLLIKDSKLLLADECCCGNGDDDDEPDCNPGDPDPLCSHCLCADALPTNFNVTISGFPATCMSDTFNGSWTLPWIRDCTWEYEIDQWFALRLFCQAGPFWILFWAATNSYGGYFGGYGGEECAPETQIFYPWSCSAYGCTDLCNTFYNSCVAVVSRG